MNLCAILTRVAMDHHGQTIGIEQMLEQLRQHRREGCRHAAIDQHHAAMNACGVGLRTYGVDELAVTGTRVVADVQMEARGRGAGGPAVLRLVTLHLAAQIANQTDAEAREGDRRILLGGAAESLGAVQNACAHAPSVRRRMSAEIAEVRQPIQGQ